MVTRRTNVNPRFVFKKEWVFDPVPPWLKLDRGTLAKIKQLKADFTKQVNEALEAAQKNVKPGG